MRKLSRFIKDVISTGNYGGGLIYKMAKAGEIKTIKIGNRLYIEKEEEERVIKDVLKIGDEFVATAPAEGSIEDRVTKLEERMNLIQGVTNESNETVRD